MSDALNGSGLEKLHIW